ncbi:MAG: UbiD family decarboxylase [Microbacterium sp.]|uniref:UbiD family decarboxylase domain-containing protein n=1 Tax=Microbacterium sp. TaxID=51671 RepID=UPI0039E3A665
MDQSCRSFLDDLARDGEVLDLVGPVALDYELAAMIGLVDAGPAVRVARTDGSEFPVFANVLNSRTRIARALGCLTRELSARIARATTVRTPPVVVSHAPVQHTVLRAEDHEDLLALLPIPRFFERDSGRYLTAGLIVAHEPSTGHRNASYARIKPLGDNRAFIGIAPNHHLMALAQEAARQGRPLDVAITLGAHPAIQLASCLYLGLGDDELDHAADLLGEPVRVVPGITVDVHVPADAEFAIEARLHPDRPIEEGWVSEYHGMYEDYGAGLEVEITAITHRRDARFQVILPGLFSEHALLGALPIGAGLVTALRAARIDVADLAVTRAGGGRVDVVAAVRHLKPGAAKRAFFACWSAVSMIKQITLVDDDIDVWDDEHVHWARTARMRWDEDVLIVPDVITDRNEPMNVGGLVTKIGMDATCRPDRRRTGWHLALPPADAVRAAARRLSAEHPGVVLDPGIGLAPLLERS